MLLDAVEQLDYIEDFPEKRAIAVALGDACAWLSVRLAIVASANGHAHEKALTWEEV